MSVLKIIVNEKEVLIPYTVERKYGLVNYIIKGKNAALYYFRKYDGGEFHLAYGNMKEDLSNAVIEAIKEIHRE